MTTKSNKIGVMIRLSPEDKEKLEKLAALERRTVTNWLEYQIHVQWEKHMSPSTKKDE